MRRFSSWALGALVLAAVTTTAKAQFDVNGPNAALTMQGFVASAVDPVNHRISIAVPGAVQFKVATGANANAPLILISGPTNAHVFVTPWGGSIDVGVANPVPPYIPTNVVVLGDGIFATAGPLDSFFVSDNSSPTPEFRLNVSAPAALAGSGSNGFQAVVLDGSNPPFGFDNTEVAEPAFYSGQVLTVLTGDDNTIQVPLSAGKSFNYYGTNYTDVFVNGNGLLSFTGPLAYPGGFYSGNTRAMMNDVPHIAINWQDWNISAANLSDGVLFVENGLNATITWGGQFGASGTTQPGISHFGDTDVAQFGCSLDLDDGLGSNPNDGRIVMNWTLDPAATSLNDAVVGIVRGAGLGAQNWNQDFHASPVGGPDDSLVEEHDRAGYLTAATRIGYDGLGARQAYHNGYAKFNGQVATFTPNPKLTTTGDQGYSVTMNQPRPNDAVGPLITDTGSNLGGTTITITGWFKNFDTLANPAAGSVVFDPTGANLPAVIIGVLDNSGSNYYALPNPSAPQYRDHEGLVVVVPANPGFTGAVDVRVNFEGGQSATIPGGFTYQAPGSITTTYNALTDDGNALHVLTVQPNLMFGGVNYTQFYVCANGMITFGTPSGDFSQTRNEMFNGFRTAASNPGVANPGVALFWTDQNYPIATGDDVQVTEDSTASTVEVKYRNQGYWNGVTPSGTYSVKFNTPSADSLEFNYSGVINPTNVGTTTVDLPIVGISAGSDDASFGYANNDVNLTGVSGQGIGSSVVYGPGSVYQAFGGFDAIPGLNWEMFDLQNVNGNGIFQAISLGTFTYVLF